MSSQHGSHNFTQDPLEVSSSPERPYHKSEDDEKVADVPKIVSKEKNRKSVSINYPKIEKEQPLNNHPAENMAADSETTPLLHPSSSLPTLVGGGFDDVESDFQGPSGTTRSEIGQSELVRKRRKRRHRYNTLATAPKITKPRPLIISPFMPISTQISIDVPQRGSDRSRAPTAAYGSINENLLPRDSSGESGSDEDEEEKSEVSEGFIKNFVNMFQSLTSRECLTIAMLCVANLCSTVAFSCIAPFYPVEAKMKGLSETQIGIVFGIFELTMFVASPIFGKYILKIGAKRLFIVGICVTGVTAILFGFLNFLPSGNIFFYASLTVRVLEALGDSAFVTSSFAISAKSFPRNIALIVGLIETFAGLGYTAGPMIGGVLYDLGGFQVPFLVLGIVLLVATVLAFCLVEECKDETVNTGERGIIAMLSIREFWIPIFAVVACAISLSFLDPTLQGHLESFQLSSTMVGFMFLICGGLYTVTAPCFGGLMDHYHCGNLFIILGSASTILSMIFIGPSPLVATYFSKDLYVIGLSLAVLGMAASALYIPCFQILLDSAKRNGFKDNFHTYGCVSGLFQAAFGFGSFVGPTLGSLLYESVGFPWTTSIIALLHVLLLLIMVVNILCK